MLNAHGSVSVHAGQEGIPMTAERILDKKGHKVFTVDEGATLAAVVAELARRG